MNREFKLKYFRNINIYYFLTVLLIYKDSHFSFFFFFFFFDIYRWPLEELSATRDIRFGIQHGVKFILHLHKNISVKCLKASGKGVNLIAC